MYRIRFLLLAITCATIQGQTAMPTKEFTLTSPAFKNNEMIPIQYTCDGADVSPALQWHNAPKNTQSFALIVNDPDAPKKVFVHWVVFNIPGNQTELPENVKKGDFLQGNNDFEKKSYGGPCPPSGMHHYYFTLYALDTHLNLPSEATKEELFQAMEHHVLGAAKLIGIYKRKQTVQAS